MLLIALVDFMVLLRNLIKNIKKLIKNIEIYMHEILLIKGAKPNQKLDIVRYNRREFVITVIVITEFDSKLIVNFDSSLLFSCDNIFFTFFSQNH